MKNAFAGVWIVVNDIGDIRIEWQYGKAYFDTKKYAEAAEHVAVFLKKKRDMMQVELMQKAAQIEEDRITIDTIIRALEGNDNDN
jgi:hypothetical protein